MAKQLSDKQIMDLLAPAPAIPAGLTAINPTGDVTGGGNVSANVTTPPVTSPVSSKVQEYAQKAVQDNVPEKGTSEKPQAGMFDSITNLISSGAIKPSDILKAGMLTANQGEGFRDYAAALPSATEPMEKAEAQKAELAMRAKEAQAQRDYDFNKILMEKEIAGKQFQQQMEMKQRDDILAPIDAAEKAGKIPTGTAAKLASKSLAELKNLNTAQHGWDLPGLGHVGGKSEITTGNPATAKTVTHNGETYTKNPDGTYTDSKGNVIS